VTGYTPLQHEADGLAAGLPPLMVAADQLASSVNLGIHGRRKAGMGESFWQFRRYAATDSVSRIDWRQSARSPHLFVREREWEVAETVWFWRDRGPAMEFRSGTVSKRERADLLLLALASLLVRGGERVGLMGAPFRPAASRLALSRIGHALLDSTGAETDSGPPPVPATPGAQLVWLGDFLSPDAEEQMRRLARAGLTGHLLRLVDPAEEDFPFAGRTLFESAKGKDPLLFGRAENIGPAYRARFKAHGEKIATTAAQLGWTATVHRTDRAPLAALVAMHAAIGGV
jgi:uncharacterized protein (DUF58 family)